MTRAPDDDEDSRAGWRMLKETARGALRYRLTAYEEVTQALDRTRHHPPREPNAGLPPEVEAEALKQFYDRHYRRWLDEPIPALGGRTPRHAVRLKSQRTKVIDLLKQLEYGEAYAVREGRQPYDFGWLWHELGLDRPGQWAG
jgi:hypothetical protein